LLSSSSRLHRLYQFSSVVNLNLPLTLTLPSAGILMPNLRPLHSKENKLTSNIRSDRFPPTEVQELPMTVRNRMKQALTVLLPAGVLGISALLATVQAEATSVNRKSDAPRASVAERLSEIRAGVSEVEFKERQGSVADAAMLGEWPNWHVGWGNGWHNHGWPNGWHNWHNFWHNW